MIMRAYAGLGFAAIVTLSVLLMMIAKDPGAQSRLFSFHETEWQQLTRECATRLGERYHPQDMADCRSGVLGR